jgi:hypothetical protein
VPHIHHLDPPIWRLLPPSLVLGLSLVLAGCATRSPAPPIPRYVAPAAGATAKLVMRATVPAGDLYGVFVLDDTEQCGRPQLVGVGDAKRSPVSSALAAGRLQTVEFRLIKPGTKQSCAIRWSFNPVAGKSYLVRGATLPAGCIAVVLNMTDPEKIRPEPTALRRNGGGNACLPLAQSKPATTASGDPARAGEGEDAVLRQGAGAEDLQGLIGQ